MKHYDEQLQQLQRDMARSKQLSAKVEELRVQKNILASRVRTLESVMHKEAADAARLEGRSLTVFFLRLTGKIGEKLDAEQREAYAARVKYDAEALTLTGVKADLERCQQELARLRGCEQRYALVLKEKQAAVRSAGGPTGEALLKMEEELSGLNVRKKELDEAVLAGSTAWRTTEQILDSLDSAESWGTWDLAGGGLIADTAKHSHLDDAQERVERLQDQLRRFQTELADVRIRGDIQLNVEGFLRFADYFFDGLFADWAVLDRIGKAQWKVKETQKQIEAVLSKLKPLLAQTDARRNQLLAEIDSLVRQA